MIKSNRGQLSIFMGITLIIVMSMLAFIINVGLFVKAKINLQNATDAAAFSGAATQARQLTNIAYVNWELRNTYKEWMFKYYVLGQLGLFSENLSDAKLSGNGAVNFLLKSPPSSFGTQNAGKNFDQYNIPSICIHNNSKTTICSTYSLPGIPRFPDIGVAGIKEIHEAFVDSLVAAKGKDCSSRSKLNYLVAQAWAYGSGSSDDGQTPMIAVNRPGAWAQALELSFRMRNLEMIVNRPPVENITRQNINQFQGKGENIGFNERPLKAFWSAYRNLGGGAYKEAKSGVSGGEELSKNFSLTELSPQVFEASQNSVSGFLIPGSDGFSYPDGTTALQKHYLDLQLMPVNYATLFSTFVTTSGISQNVATEAGCGVSKTAMPVPGYILGFNKNPEVLTYYAVKGESKFIGLFFPIGNSDGIKLTAYAAAKPYGGRIGPKLFQYSENDSALKAREDVNRRSGPYVSGLSLDPFTPGYLPGKPIPSTQKFWLFDKNNLIGGVPGTGKEITFGVPNMIYDFQNENDLSAQMNTSEFVQIVDYKNQQPAPILGLYHSPQLKALKESLGSVLPGSSMTGDDVLSSIVKARRATKYDTINYLVPNFGKTPDGNNAAPVVQSLGPNSKVGFTYKLFAPLQGEGLLYTNSDQVKTTITTYIESSNIAIKTYLEALKDVAEGIIGLNATTKGDNTTAALSIHVNAGKPGYPAIPLLDDADCKQDMASKFNYFFNTKKTITACNVTPLQTLMVDFIEKQSLNINGLDKKLFYVSSYYDGPNALKAEDLMTAYFPGKRQGTTQGDRAIAEHPLKIAGETYSARRNFYSTKFFNMAKVFDGHRDYIDTPALREQASRSPDDLLGNVQLKNPLKFSDLGNNKYFLDF
ncbi:MAG: Tad domain-containing protein [Bacteriovorax sp.]|nr:Tad domain-containing protein [Bacteriovorax sp.]